MSGIAFSAARTRSRRSASSCSHATSASRASIARAVGQRRGDVGGEQARAGRGQAAVDLAEQAAGDAARRPSGVSSRLSRVAASIAIWLERAIRRGASSRMPAPFCVASR